MSPYRTGLPTQLASITHLESAPAVLAVSGGIVTTLLAYLSGAHMVLLYATALAQIADMWTGSERARRTNPPSYDRRLLKQGLRKKLYLLGAILLCGPAVDLAAHAIGAFFRTPMLEEVGRTGAITMLGLAALFSYEAKSALDNLRATAPGLAVGSMMAGIRFSDVTAGQKADALSPDGTVHARRRNDVLLRELQEAGAAPLVPGEGLVPLDAEVAHPPQEDAP